MTYKAEAVVRWSPRLRLSLSLSLSLSLCCRLEREDTVPHRAQDLRPSLIIIGCISSHGKLTHHAQNRDPTQRSMRSMIRLCMGKSFCVIRGPRCSQRHA